MRFQSIRLSGLALGAVLGLPPGAAGQGSPAHDSLLIRLTREAVSSAPAVLRAEAQARAAAGRVRPAGAPADPMLSIGVMNLTLPRLAFRESDFTEVDIEASQALPWPGTLSAQTGTARATARGMEAGAGALRREVVIRVATAYYRLRYLVAARAILARQRQLLESVVEISTARYATGSASQSEPLQARIALARLAADSAALGAEDDTFRAELRAVRGIRGPEQLEVRPIEPDSVAAVLIDAEALHAAQLSAGEPLAAHPRLVTRQAEIEAGEHAARAATLQGRPDFVLSTRYGARPLGSDFFSAFAGVRLPIWASRKQGLLAEAARTDAEAARRGLEAERAALTAELERTLADARAGGTRLRLMVQRVLPLTREGIEAALRDYRTGQAGFLSVLSAQDAGYRSELETADVAAQHSIHLVMLEQLLAPEDSP